MRVFLTLVFWTNENNSCMELMRVDKRDESLHVSFLNYRVLVKREQELHES